MTWNRGWRWHQVGSWSTCCCSSRFRQGSSGSVRWCRSCRRGTCQCTGWGWSSERRIPCQWGTECRSQRRRTSRCLRGSPSTKWHRGARTNQPGRCYTCRCQSTDQHGIGSSIGRNRAWKRHRWGRQSRTKSHRWRTCWQGTGRKTRSWGHCRCQQGRKRSYRSTRTFRRGT